MAEIKKQVNVDFTNFPELLDDLDKMVEDDDTDRSKFIRKLVRQENAHRKALENQPMPTPKKSNRSTQALAA